MNGGIAVDIWGRCSLEGCYAIGEAAGTHGVTRPGGAALNAGQVLGQRCAEHIFATRAEPRGETGSAPALEAAVAAISAEIKNEGLDVREVARQVQARMSDHAGFLCSPEGVREALAGARRLNAEIRAHGLRVGRAEQASLGVQWRHMALASEAVLTSLDAYIAQGGGSRGARAICDAAGAEIPWTKSGPLEAFRFRAERRQDRAHKIMVRFDGERFLIEMRETRKHDRAKPAYFERDWTRFLSGAIYVTSLH
jgi:aspartate oxidase